MIPLAQNEQEANMVLSTLFGGNATMDLAGVASAVESGGEAFSTPYARLKEGKWEAPKSTDPKVYDYMPVSDRPFYGVYLGYRLGATGWRGAAMPGSGGNPPLYRMAIPHPLAAGQRGVELAQKVLAVGSKVQFTKSADRVKFDSAGRLSPEIHILVWTPNAGFITLVVSGYTSVQNTLDAMKKTEVANRPGLPYKFLPEKETIVNKKAAEGAANRSWDNYHVTAAAAVDESGQRMHQAFQQFRQTHVMELQKAVAAFLNGTDYNGLSGEAIDNKLAEYDVIARG
jgi:hypothetical protein